VLEAVEEEEEGEDEGKVMEEQTKANNVLRPRVAVAAAVEAAAVGRMQAGRLLSRLLPQKSSLHWAAAVLLPPSRLLLCLRVLLQQHLLPTLQLPLLLPLLLLLLHRPNPLRRRSVVFNRFPRRLLPYA
jgi:hypothetical protein